MRLFFVGFQVPVAALFLTEQAMAQTSTERIDVKQWLKDAKLSGSYSIFQREGISIEELIPFSEEDLLSLSTETLQLTDVLHRSRFMKAMQKTKQSLRRDSANSAEPNGQTFPNKDLSQINSNGNGSISTSTSSTSPSSIPLKISRPISPLSIHSAKSSPNSSQTKKRGDGKSSTSPMTTNDRRLAMRNGNHYDSYQFISNGRRLPTISSDASSLRLSVGLEDKLSPNLPDHIASRTSDGNGAGKLKPIKRRVSPKDRNRRHSNPERPRVVRRQMSHPMPDLAELVTSKSIGGASSSGSALSHHHHPEVTEMDSVDVESSDAPLSAHSASVLLSRSRRSDGRIGWNGASGSPTRASCSRMRSNSSVMDEMTTKSLKKRTQKKRKRKKKKKRKQGPQMPRGIEKLNPSISEQHLSNTNRSKTYDTMMMVDVPSSRRPLKITRTSSKYIPPISATPTLTAMRAPAPAPAPAPAGSSLSTLQSQNGNGLFSASTFHLNRSMDREIHSNLSYPSSTLKSVHMTLSDDPDTDDNASENLQSDEANRRRRALRNHSQSAIDQTMGRLELLSSDQSEDGDQSEQGHGQQDEEQSSGNERHSDDEKWDELERNMTTGEREQMKTFSVLLQVNRADANQIAAATKTLHSNYAECESQIEECFDSLREELEAKKRQVLRALLAVKEDKEEALESKRSILDLHRNHILEQKAQCDALLNGWSGHGSERSAVGRKRLKKIAKLKEKALKLPRETPKGDTTDEASSDGAGDDVVEVHDFETDIKVHFDEEQRHLFFDRICTVDKCTIPKCPKLQIKATTSNSVTVRVVIMTTKQKKAIQRDPKGNEAKNLRIEEIEIECIQCTAAMEFMEEDEEMNNAQEKRLRNGNTLEVKGTMGTRNGSGSTPRDSESESGNYVDCGDVQQHQQRKERDTYSYCEDANNEMANGRQSRRRVARIAVDPNAKLQRIHETTVGGLVAGRIEIRARTKNISGWSQFCQVMECQLEAVHEMKWNRCSPAGGVQLMLGTFVHLLFVSLRYGSSPLSISVSIATDDKCVVFNQQTEQHQLVIANAVIDKGQYSSFQWKYTLDFEDMDDAKSAEKGGVAEKENPDAVHHEISLGFVACPIEKNVNGRLGTAGNQFGLGVRPRSHVARAYLTQNGSIHTTFSFNLHEELCSGDEFVFCYNALENKCDIFHNDQLLAGACTAVVPHQIVPAVSGLVSGSRVSCNIDFVASR